jgi:hypothetical protein
MAFFIAELARTSKDSLSVAKLHCHRALDSLELLVRWVMKNALLAPPRSAAKRVSPAHGPAVCCFGFSPQGRFGKAFNTSREKGVVVLIVPPGAWLAHQPAVERPRDGARPTEVSSPLDMLSTCRKVMALRGSPSG